MVWWSFYPLYFWFGSIFIFCTMLYGSGTKVFVFENKSCDFPFDISFVWYFDDVSKVFLLMTFSVSTMVFTYMISYMEDDGAKMGFSKILLLFSISMLLLSLSGNLFTVMIGWDGLGLSSFCLIIFYQNSKSFNSGLVTFITNRLGDVCLIMSLVFCLLTSGDWSWGWGGGNYSLLLSLGAVTKSAQYPFSSWLPRAMAAPTPVSALVHSSTLVTAGIFVIVRFLSVFPPEVQQIIQLLSIMSIVLSGLSSLGEFDFKKIIALSTLSHISLIIFVISLGSVEVGLLHMFLHAMFKSTLFMVSGWIIHSFGGEQDIRRLSIWSMHPSVSVSTILCLSSMAGIPFLGSFFSKEMILSMSTMLSKVTYFSILCLASSLTCSYSIRMLLIITKKSPSVPMTVDHCSNRVNKCMIWGSILSSIISGMLVSILMKGYVSVPCSWGWKVTLFLSLLFGMWVGWWSLEFNSFFVSRFKNMWCIESVNEVIVKVIRLTSWKTMFLFGVKGILDLPVYRSGVNWWSQISDFSMHGVLFPYPTSVVKWVSVSIFVLIILI